MQAWVYGCSHRDHFILAVGRSGTGRFVFTWPELVTEPWGWMSHITPSLHVGLGLFLLCDFLAWSAADSTQQEQGQFFPSHVRGAASDLPEKWYVYMCESVRGGVYVRTQDA